MPSRESVPHTIAANVRLLFADSLPGSGPICYNSVKAAHTRSPSAVFFHTKVKNGNPWPLQRYGMSGIHPPISASFPKPLFSLTGGQTLHSPVFPENLSAQPSKNPQLCGDNSLLQCSCLLPVQCDRWEDNRHLHVWNKPWSSDQVDRPVKAPPDLRVTKAGYLRSYRSEYRDRHSWSPAVHFPGRQYLRNPMKNSLLADCQTLNSVFQ